MEFKPLELNEKLRQIREAKGMLQRELAYATGYTTTAVSSIETGANNCTSDALRLFRAGLGIEHLPLFESERQTFKEKGYKVCALIDNRKVKEAKELLGEMSGIVFFPFDPELIAFYRLIECKLLIRDYNLEAAKEILDGLELSLDGASNDIMYYYYCITGLLDHRSNRYESARVILNS